MKPISHVEPYSGYSGLTPRSLRLAKKYAVPKCVFARQIRTVHAKEIPAIKLSRRYVG